MTLSRMLAAMLATAALITTPAAAKPIDGPVDMHQSTAEARARALAAEEKQDLRMPDRRDDESATMKMLRLAGPPTWPAYPSPIEPAAPSKPVAPTTSDDGIDWATIAIGVGLSVAVVCAIGAASTRLRRRYAV